jgi:hypothetical protein
MVTINEQKIELALSKERTNNINRTRLLGVTSQTKQFLVRTTKLLDCLPSRIIEGTINGNHNRIEGASTGKQESRSPRKSSNLANRLRFESFDQFKEADGFRVSLQRAKIGRFPKSFATGRGIVTYTNCRIKPHGLLSEIQRPIELGDEFRDMFSDA